MFRCDQEEQYYGAKYKIEKIDQNKIGKVIPEASPIQSQEYLFAEFYISCVFCMGKSSGLLFFFLFLAEVVEQLHHGWVLGLREEGRHHVIHGWCPHVLEHLCRIFFYFQ